jgi:hypothetical protein
MDNALSGLKNLMAVGGFLNIIQGKRLATMHMLFIHDWE